MNQPKRIEIGKPSQIPLRGSRTVSTDEGDIAIFRTAEETFFAVKDSCPHRQGPLSQGIVHGNRVTCPLQTRGVLRPTRLSWRETFST